MALICVFITKTRRILLSLWSPGWIGDFYCTENDDLGVRIFWISPLLRRSLCGSDFMIIQLDCGPFKKCFLSGRWSPSGMFRRFFWEVSITLGKPHGHFTASVDWILTMLKTNRNEHIFLRIQRSLSYLKSSTRVSSLKSFWSAFPVIKTSQRIIHFLNSDSFSNSSLFTSI